MKCNYVNRCIIVIIMMLCKDSLLNIYAFSNHYFSIHNLYHVKSNHLLSTKKFITTKTQIEIPSIDPKILSKTTLLVNLWGAITFPSDIEDDDGELDFVLDDYQLNRNDMEGFIKHFQACKDCSADQAFLMATQNDNNQDILKLTNIHYNLLSEDGDDDDWGTYENDPLVQELHTDKNELLTPIFPIEESDEIILRDTKIWVQKVIADFAVCPFTVDPDRAGIPMGGVRYSVSRATTPEEAFYRYWEEVLIVLQTPEKQLSTVLLVFPELELFGNYELFEAYCDCLSDALTKSALNLEAQIQLVFFHPKFQFRDGQARTGSKQGAANYARRGPWPMINILRTPQVRAAQKGVPTGVVYQQNEERLNEVGSEILEGMLYQRDWTGLPVHSMSSKTLRKTLEENNLLGDRINLLDPILTSLSDSKPLQRPIGLCPINHSTTTTNSGRVIADNDNITESPTLIGEDHSKKCPVTHTPTTDEDNNSDDEEVKSSSEEVIDYLKFAEEIDQWLQTTEEEEEEAKEDL